MLTGRPANVFFCRQRTHNKKPTVAEGARTIDRQKSVYTDLAMTTTGAEELVGVCYVDLVLRWEILVPGMFVGYFLCQALCSCRFSTWLAACYVTAVVYLCAAVGTAAFVDATMISARPVGYKWCAVLNHLAVPLFQRTFITSAIAILVGTLVSWAVQGIFGVIDVVITRGLQSKALTAARHRPLGRLQRNL